jgi:hypothetical protein
MTWFLVQMDPSPTNEDLQAVLHDRFWDCAPVVEARFEELPAPPAPPQS